MLINPIKEEILIPRQFSSEDVLDAVMYGLAKFNRKC